MVYCECIGSDIVLCTFCIVKQTWQDCYESEKSAPNPWLLSDQWLTIVHPWVTFIQIISGHWRILVLFAESHSCQLWVGDSEAWLKLRTGLPSRMCNRDTLRTFQLQLHSLPEASPSRYNSCEQTASSSEFRYSLQVWQPGWIIDLLSFCLLLCKVITDVLSCSSILFLWGEN